MKDKISKKKYDKLYKKVRNSSFLGTVLSFSLLMILFVGIMVFNSVFFLEYVFESKFAEEHRRLSMVSDMRDHHGDPLEMEEFYKENDISFYVKDDQGTTLMQRGDDTCTFEGSVINMTEEQEHFLVYLDEEDNFFYIKDHHLKLKWDKLVSWILEHWKDDESIKELKLPFWISMEHEDKGEVFVGKAYLTLNVHDMILVAEIGAVILVLAVFVLILTVVNIITGIHKMNNVIRLYHHDPVTNGYNWTWYQKSGDKRIRGVFTKKSNWASVNLMLRNYRSYCVCHSVESGEALLSRLYEVLEERTEKKELCAHVTSSNFALLLKYEDEERLKMRLHEIMNELSKVEERHNLSFRAGVALIPGVVSGSEEASGRKKLQIKDIYNNACAAGSMVKDTVNSGLYVFDDKLLEEQKWRDIVHEKRNGALMNEEYKVYYQPKYNPKDDTLRGAEALIRWESPEYGFITPGRFIPIFESDGFITEIDHYMLKHVARDQKTWLSEGFQCVPVSVNVSRAHFSERDLAEQIRDIVDAEGCPHELIEIELTESAFFDDKDTMVETIKRLKTYGFVVSMDDFGAGYSSLNSLKDMPLDVLKLDAEFFRGEFDGDRGEVVVSEAIKLAKSLKMRTVAEGVEDKKQVDFLAEQGCDMIQGFYYAKPMPKDEYESRMNGQNNLA